MAVANYHEEYGSFPPAYMADISGRPIHSWRILILPFLGERALYAKYSFAEPWDGPNNRKLAGEIGSVYTRPGLEPDQNHSTSFVAVIGPHTAWPGSTPARRDDLRDGAENTFLVVEVRDGQFPWMEPRDLEFDRMSFAINDRSGQGLGSRLGGARVVSADTTVRTLPDNFDPKTLRAMLTADGGEAVPESP